MNIHIPVYTITIEEFDDLSIEDVNYSGILFIFEEQYKETVCNKINELQLGKGHRLKNVLEDGMFYIENCDIQIIDNMQQLFSELYHKDSINKIYVLGATYII